MIEDFVAAVIADMDQVPGVATRERYVGQLDESAQVMIKLPALLFAMGEWKPGEDDGSGRIGVTLTCSLFVAVRNARGSEARAAAVDLLCEALIPLIHLSRFGLKVEPARLDRVVPHYNLEPHGVGVREIRWTQSVLLGESAWVGEGEPPSVLYLGITPEVGLGHEDDYFEVTELPEVGP